MPLSPQPTSVDPQYSYFTLTTALGGLQEEHYRSGTYAEKLPGTHLTILNNKE